MERRKFITSGIAAATIPTACATTRTTTPLQETEVQNELYEWREYDIKWGSNMGLLSSYLKDVLKPTLLRLGANHFLVFEEIAPGGPKKLYTLISYPDANAYVRSQQLDNDEGYVKAAADYNAISPDKPVYNRYSTSLLHAFDGLKQMMNPVDGASVFELRIYEGATEDAVRRKIQMFDKEEIDLFLKVGLNPVFFGRMISGPYMPCLVYMINFSDMESHGAAWKSFVKSPEWNEMKDKPEYAKTLSNIRNVFLKPV